MRRQMPKVRELTELNTKEMNMFKFKVSVIELIDYGFHMVPVSAVTPKAAAQAILTDIGKKEPKWNGREYEIHVHDDKNRKHKYTGSLHTEYYTKLRYNKKQKTA